MSSNPSPQEVERELVAFPPLLGALINNELAAGNTIDEIGHSFPAPPRGGYVKFVRGVTTRPRADGNGLSFRARNSSLSSGEFTDDDRVHFVVEPPGPPPREVDMDAIRAAHDVPVPELVMREAGSASAPPIAQEDDAVLRFERSMQVTYEMWHDGIGYDLDALHEATPEGRASIERTLLARGVSDWRDVEALLSLGTSAALDAVAVAGLHGSGEIRLTVAQEAPDLVAEERRVAAIVHALETSTFLDGLSRALNLAAVLHPPAIIDALLRGARAREGGVAVHFAALLLFVHGLTNEHFDSDERPFTLRFHAKEPERWELFQVLCARIGVDPQPYRTLRA